jgi:TPR repeat protein
VQLSPFDLYLQSALSGSAFSLSRLGALCSEGTLSDENLDHAEAALDQLQSSQPLRSCVDNDSLPRSSRLARRFWLETALRGNPFAQVALAEEIMAHEGTTKRTMGDRARESEAWLLAAVLFGMAAEQGDGAAIDALERVVALEVSILPALTQGKFEQLPVVKVARASLSFL